MTPELNVVSAGKLLHIQVTGKLTKASYKGFTPLVDRLIREHGNVRVLFEMHDFHGWTAAALWEDLKFDLGHWKDIERLAMVGEAKWEQGMAAFCKPFTSAQVRYFDRAQIEEAKRWVEEP